MKSALPCARRDGLLVKTLPDEVLIYDLGSDKAHCLNQTAALVWKYCDGTRSTSEIKEAMERDTATVLDERIVWLGLNQLQEFNLLEGDLVRPQHLAGISRRELVRTVGVAALTLPLVVSILAPTAKAAGSCAPPGGACGSNNQCCSNNCAGSPGNTCPVGTPNNTCC